MLFLCGTLRAVPAGRQVVAPRTLRLMYFYRREPQR